MQIFIQRNQWLISESEFQDRKECKLFFHQTFLSPSFGSWKDFFLFMVVGLIIECVDFLGISFTRTLPSLCVTFGMLSSADSQLR
jgi:hypothetical protein